MDVTPAAAIIVGSALGSVIGGLIALPSFDRVSCILWPSLIVAGGV